MTTGEYQSEAAAALNDWDKRRYETEEERQKRERIQEMIDGLKKQSAEP